jgi:hypothetical protein
MVFIRKERLAGLTPDLELQLKVSKILGLGFALSIVHIGGFGSLAALILGLRAKRLMRSSPKTLGGAVLMWWCIIMGALGSPFLVWTIMLTVKSLRFPG